MRGWMDGGRGERGIERECAGRDQSRNGGREGGKESLPVSHQEGRKKKAVQQHSLESYPHPYFEHAPTKNYKPRRVLLKLKKMLCQSFLSLACTRV